MPGSRVLGVGHRVVHGGARFAGPTTRELHKSSRNYANWCRSRQFINRIISPPSRLSANDYRTCRRSPALIRVFIEDNPQLRSLSRCHENFGRQGVQRYGFHGLSYEYIASVLPEVAPELAGGRIIVAHLGSGASMCAMREGKSIDTTLGFTALDGLCMGTRPGSIDPGCVLHLFQGLNLSVAEVEKIALQGVRSARYLRNQQRYAGLAGAN